MEVEDVELQPFVAAPYMSIIVRGKGRMPEQEVRLQAIVVLKVEEFEEFISGFGYSLAAPASAVRPRHFQRLIDPLDGIDYLLPRTPRVDSGHYSLQITFRRGNLTLNLVKFPGRLDQHIGRVVRACQEQV